MSDVKEATNKDEQHDDSTTQHNQLRRLPEAAAHQGEAQMEALTAVKAAKLAKELGITNKRLAQPGVMDAIALARQSYPEEMAQFVQQYATGVNLKADDPAYALREVTLRTEDRLDCAPVLGAFAFVARYQREKLAEFMAQYRTGVNLRADDPAYVLREYVLVRGPFRSAEAQRDAVLHTLAAVKAFIEDQKMTKLPQFGDILSYKRALVDFFEGSNADAK